MNKPFRPWVVDHTVELLVTLMVVVIAGFSYDKITFKQRVDHELAVRGAQGSAAFCTLVVYDPTETVADKLLIIRYLQAARPGTKCVIPPNAVSAPPLPGQPLIPANETPAPQTPIMVPGHSPAPAAVQREPTVRSPKPTPAPTVTFTQRPSPTASSRRSPSPQPSPSATRSPPRVLPSLLCQLLPTPCR